MIPLLEVKDLSLILSGKSVLKNICLTIASGEFLGVIGPNGGGKTSLLRLLLGIIRPTRGQVSWTQNACGLQPRIGYVPQRVMVDRCYPLNAREIVQQGASGSFPFSLQAARKTASRADKLMDRFGLKEQSKTSFIHLSGGQQRRCLLARALMNAPSALFLDEPTAGVDTEGQMQFGSILKELSSEGITIILVSHDIPLITRHASRIACLDVTLHWHGKANALDEKTVFSIYRREIERYQMRPSQVASNHVSISSKEGLE